MKIRLTKLSENKTDIRTKTIDGVPLQGQMPTVGKPFVMLAEPLEGGDIRIFNTSPIVRLQEVGEVIQFWTESNSHYQIEMTDLQ